MSDDGLSRHAPAALVLIDVIQPFDFDGADDLLEHARPASERIAALKKRAKAAGLPTFGLSPTPFAPMGWCGLGVTVIQPLQSIVWQTLRRCGIKDRIEGYGRLLRDF